LVSNAPSIVALRPAPRNATDPTPATAANSIPLDSESADNRVRIARGIRAIYQQLDSATAEFKTTCATSLMK
jgi:hypothetical protein